MSKMYTPRLFLPEIVRSHVKPRRPGVYMIGNNEKGFDIKYIGRSDKCLQNRLATHNLLYKYDYFVFRYAKDPAHAYQLECQLWHSLPDRELRNAIHPASPKNSQLECPYCHFVWHINRILA